MSTSNGIPDIAALEAAVAKEAEEQAKTDAAKAATENAAAAAEGEAKFDVEGFVAAVNSTRSTEALCDLLDAAKAGLATLEERDKTRVDSFIERQMKSLEALEAIPVVPSPARRMFRVEVDAVVNFDGHHVDLKGGNQVAWTDAEVACAMAAGAKLKPLDDPQDPIETVARASYEADRALAGARGGDAPPEWLKASDADRDKYRARAKKRIGA